MVTTAATASENSQHQRVARRSQQRTPVPTPGHRAVAGPPSAAGEHGNGHDRRPTTMAIAAPHRDQPTLARRGQNSARRFNGLSPLRLRPICDYADDGFVRIGPTTSGADDRSEGAYDAATERDPDGDIRKWFTALHREEQPARTQLAPEGSDTVAARRYLPISPTTDGYFRERCRSQAPRRAPRGRPSPCLEEISSSRLSLFGGPLGNSSRHKQGVESRWPSEL